MTEFANPEPSGDLPRDLDTLIQEANSFAAEIFASLRVATAFVPAGLAAIAFAAREGGSGFLVAHFAVGVLLVYSTQIFTDVGAMVGYREFLEVRVNAHSASTVMAWSLGFAKKRRRARSTFLLGAFLVVVFLGLGIPSVGIASKHLGWGGVAAHIVATALISWAAIAAGKEMRQAPEKARRAAEAEHLRRSHEEAFPSAP